jgi:hypothetical protein
MESVDYESEMLLKYDRTSKIYLSNDPILKITMNQLVISTKFRSKKRARLRTCSLRLRLARPLRRRCRRRSSRLAGLNYNKIGRFGRNK